jgi:hypothetical protein
METMWSGPIMVSFVNGIRKEECNFIELISITDDMEEPEPDSGSGSGSGIDDSDDEDGSGEFRVFRIFFNFLETFLE